MAFLFFPKLFALEPDDGYLCVAKEGYGLIITTIDNAHE